MIADLRRIRILRGSGGSAAFILHSCTLINEPESQFESSYVIDPDISGDARDMIQRHMATMDHVELLMLLRNGREDSFPVSRLAELMRKPEGLVTMALESLAAAGLVAQLTDGTYRYSAREDKLDRTAESVIQLYNERPVTLVRLLYERPPTAVNTFADAFKLRKDP